MLVLTAETRQFEFELDGVAYAVTALDNIPLARTDTLKGATTDAEAVAWIRAEIFEKEVPEAVAKLTVGQWKTLVKAYLEDSAASAGELPA